MIFPSLQSEKKEDLQLLPEAERPFWEEHYPVLTHYPQYPLLITLINRTPTGETQVPLCACREFALFCLVIFSKQSSMPHKSHIISVFKRKKNPRYGLFFRASPY